MNLSFLLKPIILLRSESADVYILKKIFPFRYSAQYKEISTDILLMHYSKLAPWVIKEMLTSNLFDVEDPEGKMTRSRIYSTHHIFTYKCKITEEGIQRHLKYRTLRRENQNRWLSIILTTLIVLMTAMNLYISYFKH